MEEKIPCIKCDSRLWEYIKSYLEEWGYKNSASFDYDWGIYSLLVINYLGDVGYINNLQCTNYITINSNRELVTNVEEFLERAAKLKGFTYKRKDITEKEFDVNKLEVGMIIEYKSGERSLVLSDSKGNLFLSGVNYFKPVSYTHLTLPTNSLV